MSGSTVTRIYRRLRGSIVGRIKGGKEEEDIMTRQEEHIAGDDQADAEAKMVVLGPRKIHAPEGKKPDLD
jgi:hypothetical protein